jgi:hypothetical protein
MLGEGAVGLSRVVGEGIFGKLPFEKLPEGGERINHVEICRKSTPDRADNGSFRPEVGGYLVNQGSGRPVRTGGVKVRGRRS